MGDVCFAPCHLSPRHITILILPIGGIYLQQKEPMDTAHSHPEIILMQAQIASLDQKVNRHEEILVTGHGDVLSLPEIVRTLSVTVDTYIKRKDREEADKREFWDKFRWVIIATIIPVLLGFFYQLFVFYFRIVPTLANLSQ